MRQIWKYRLTQGQQVIPMPQGVTLLSVGLDPLDALCVWALVAPERVRRNVYILVTGTGHDLNEDVLMADFVGTVKQEQFMWHVFRIVE